MLKNLAKIAVLTATIVAYSDENLDSGEMKQQSNDDETQADSQTATFDGESSTSFKDKFAYDPVEGLAQTEKMMRDTPHKQAQMIQTKVEKVNKFHEEISAQLQVLQTGMQGIQEAIQQNLGSPENSEGYLLGEVGDYLESFDDQVFKFDSMIGNVRQHWLEKKEMLEETAATGDLTDVFTDDLFAMKSIDFEKCKLEELTFGQPW